MATLRNPLLVEYMTPLLPVVSPETLLRLAKRIQDLGEVRFQEDCVKNIDLILEENPVIASLIMSAVLQDPPLSLSYYMTSVYMVLRDQAETDRMEEEIKL